jgi:hypothetical protein
MFVRYHIGRTRKGDPTFFRTNFPNRRARSFPPKIDDRNYLRDQ